MTQGIRSLTISFLIVLSMHPLASAAWTPGDETACPAKGKYQNETYGFRVQLPPGYKGCPDSPVGMSDHGVVIRIGADASIDVFGSYNAPLYGSVDEYAESSLKYLADGAAPGSTSVRFRGSSRLGSLEAVHFVITYLRKDSNVARTQDQTVALRKVRGSYYLSYAVSLDTPSSNYSKDRQVLEAILASWSITDFAK